MQLSHALYPKVGLPAVFRNTFNLIQYWRSFDQHIKLERDLAMDVLVISNCNLEALHIRIACKY